jgi:hypothetical protein
MARLSEGRAVPAMAEIICLKSGIYHLGFAGGPAI